MDIPLPEELEWIERNTIEDEEYLELCPEEYEEPSQISKIVSGLPVAGGQTPVKRPRSPTEVFITVEEELEKKRNKKSLEDEDWLRFSPNKGSDNFPLVDVGNELDLLTTEEKTISRFASEIDGDCISITGPCGHRVYAKITKEMNMNDTSKRTGNLDRTSTRHLLSENINVLLERVEQDTLTKALQDSYEACGNSLHPAASVVSEQLWVDKYTPKSFSELLSDEQTNREVLSWLKQWDSYVFGSPIKTTGDDVLSSLRRHSHVAKHQKVFDSKHFLGTNRGSSLGNQISQKTYSLDHEENNSSGVVGAWDKKTKNFGPPEQKVLLLCGSPGLGKTTLAHVAAKHCGYRVVEINASDDRSSSTIESKILDVVQMNSVTSDSKPKCLVIDEIDGTLGEGKGAVEAILKLIGSEKKSTVGKHNVSSEAEQEKGSSKPRPKTATLSRPVICICNDIYAPALRQLRQIAKVYSFVQPTISRVVNRLKYICKMEGFKTSAIALTTLAEYTECDIRSCLNTLQFLHRKREALNILEVGDQVVGRKDMSKSFFDVWKEIFQKRKTKAQKISDNRDINRNAEFDFLYNLTSNRGDYELTIDGIHENILQLRYHDPLMQKTVRCFDILGNFDSMLRYMMRTQNMSLLVYQPLVAIAIRALTSQMEKPNIQWPKTYQRNRAILLEKKDLLKSWHNRIQPFISRHLSIESFVQEFVSPLLQILSPPSLKPVSLHLLSEKEKDDLFQLIDTMVSYCITYRNIKIETLSNKQRQEPTSDAPTLSLDPPIGSFINFKGYGSVHLGLPLAMKQILVHEVEKQKIKRESSGTSIQIDKGNNCSGQIVPVDNNALGNDKEKSKKVGETSKNSSMRSRNGVDVNLKSSSNIKKPSSSSFFDRFRKPRNEGSEDSNCTSNEPATLARDSRPLLFKFNEGFTNAVKRPIRMRELLM